MHKETIKVPANAGGYYIEGLGIYAWQKTYSRFFSESKVKEINILISIETFLASITFWYSKYKSR